MSSLIQNHIKYILINYEDLLGVLRGFWGEEEKWFPFYTASKQSL